MPERMEAIPFRVINTGSRMVIACIVKRILPKKYSIKNSILAGFSNFFRVFIVSGIQAITIRTKPIRPIS